MALEIKAIPTLTGEEALRFEKEAERLTRAKKKIDFSKQIELAKKILTKAKLL